MALVHPAVARGALGTGALLACVLLPLAGGAQSLPRVHITALGMHADKATVAPSETFHVTIHVHITQQRERLDDLVLPTLTNAVILGDERRRVAVATGTDFYEILTVSANAPGDASFSPAYVDALDTLSGKGLRFSSNALTVRVRGTPAIDTVTQSVTHAVRDIALTMLAIVLVGVLGIVAVVRARRSRRTAPPAAPAVPLAPVWVAPQRDPLEAAAERYRRDQSDAALDALREVLFTRAGAEPGATMTDALRALGARDADLARTIAVAERARFAPEPDRTRASGDLLDRLETLVPRGTSFA